MSGEAAGPQRATRRYGARGLLVDLYGAESAHDFSSGLRAIAGELIAGTVEGERSVLALLRPSAPRAELSAAVAALPPQSRRPVTSTAPLSVPTVYDGDDLAAVAELLGISREGLVAWHTGRVWTTAFEGFSAGFSYLQTDERFRLPRRDEPRPRVPAGSVAIANEYCAIYPRAHPSGWQMIGRTTLRVWDPREAEPSLLPAGRSVRFAAVRDTATLRGPAAQEPVAHGCATEGRATEEAEAARSERIAAGLEIVRCGHGTTIQDRGRERQGVSRSGAFDRLSLAEANRALGNGIGAAGIEITMGGFACTARGPQVVCLTGATGAATVSGADGVWTVPWGEPVVLDDGETLSIDRPARGVRSYLAVRGGLDARETLGSRASDSLSRIGPEPLGAGDVVPVRRARRNQAVAPVVPVRGLPPGPVAIRVAAGPRLDHVGRRAFDDLLGGAWTVDPASSRVAVRLTGPPVRREPAGELPSEALIPGAIQLPPSSTPIVFGIDHPVTGGYPVIAVVDESDLDLLGQVAPGDELIFEASAECGQES